MAADATVLSTEKRRLSDRSDFALLLYYVLSYILLDLDDRKHSLYQISFIVVGIILARLLLTDLVVF